MMRGGRSGHFFDRATLKFWGMRISDYSVPGSKRQHELFMKYEKPDGSPIEMGEHVFFTDKKRIHNYFMKISTGECCLAFRSDEPEKFDPKEFPEIPAWV